MHIRSILSFIIFSYPLICFCQDSININSNYHLRIIVEPASPEMKGSKIINRFVGEYKDRRFLAENMELTTILTQIYQIPCERIIYKTNESQKRYNVDVIVSQRREALLNLTKRFAVETGLGIVTEIVKNDSKVGVLVREKNSVILFKKSVESCGSFYRGASSIECISQDMGMFSCLLSTSSLGLTVINETNLVGNYDINIEWEKGNIESLQRELNKLGLALKFENRKLEFLEVWFNGP